jgi:hypothetical protein
LIAFRALLALVITLETRFDHLSFESNTTLVVTNFNADGSGVFLIKQTEVCFFLVDFETIFLQPFYDELK